MHGRDHRDIGQVRTTAKRIVRHKYISRADARLSSIRHLTVSLIAPRWTGMCGALTTRSPSGVKSAQLKSSRSLTFTLLDVLRSVIPIFSAIPANWLLNSSSSTGSGCSIVWSSARDEDASPATALTAFDQQFAAATTLRPSSRDR